jgi:hypothetical protein
MGTDRGANVEAPIDDEVVYCARHPTVETTLRCGRCNTPICPRCLVQTPVGARCRECAGVKRIATSATPVLLARGLGAAAATGAALGAAWGYLLEGFGGISFLGFIIGIGIGWVLSEAIGAATKKRVDPILASMGILGAIVCYFARNVVIEADLLPRGDLNGYIITLVAAFVAYTRLNR